MAFTNIEYLGFTIRTVATKKCRGTVVVNAKNVIIHRSEECGTIGTDGAKMWIDNFIRAEFECKDEFSLYFNVPTREDCGMEHATPVGFMRGNDGFVRIVLGENHPAPISRTAYEHSEINCKGSGGLIVDKLSKRQVKYLGIRPGVRYTLNEETDDTYRLEPFEAVVPGVKPRHSIPIVCVF